MAEIGTTPDTATAHPGLFARYLGIFFSPRQTYAAVAAKPTWLGIMVITLGLVAICQYYVLSSPAMQDMMYEQAIRRQPGEVSDQAAAGIERVISILPAAISIAIFVFGPVFSAITSGILLLIFSTLMGGTATFKQVFAVNAHSGVISSVAGVLSAILIASGAMPSGGTAPGANLAIFFPFLEEGTFAVKYLAAIDLVLLWWIVSLSIGLGVLYKRRTGGIATSLIVLYLLIAVVIAAFR